MLRRSPLAGQLLYLSVLASLCACGSGSVGLWNEDDGEFWSQPWPSDQRVSFQGSPNLTGFPKADSAPLVADYVNTLESMDGYGLNGVAYFQLTGSLDLDSLPSLAESVQASSSLQWVDIDPWSPSWGHRVPVSAEFFGLPTTYLPGNTLALRPPLGFPLRPGGHYAVLLTTSLRDRSLKRLLPMEGLPELLALPSAEDLAWWLEQDRSAPAADAIVGVTSFRTARVHKELDAVLAASEDGAHSPYSLWSEEGWPQAITPPSDLESKVPQVRWFHGVYRAWNWQQGLPPYGEGGGFLLDETGQALPSYLEDIHWLLALPEGQAPEGGWPLCIYMHGTGGDRASFVRAGPQRPAKELTSRGIAVISIDQTLHGARATGNYDVNAVSFNLFNPTEVRTNFRQGGLDARVLADFVRAAMIPGGAITALHPDLRIDPNKLLYLGHSQGGLTGAITLGLHPEFRGAVLSGAGGGITETVLLRKDIIDFEDLFRTAAGIDPAETLTLFHPVLAVAQSAIDTTDPLSHADRWWDGGAEAIVMTEGLLDQATPSATAEALAGAAGLPILKPVAHGIEVLDLKGIAPVSGPVFDNIPLSDGSSATGALIQHPDYGHFLIFDHNRTSLKIYDFLRSAADDAPELH